MINDHLQLKTVQRELNQRLKESQEHHREVIEKNLQAMISKKIWDSMNPATNMKPIKKLLHVVDELAEANELNDFSKQLTIMISLNAK